MRTYCLGLSLLFIVTACSDAMLEVDGGAEAAADPTFGVGDDAPGADEPADEGDDSEPRTPVQEVPDEGDEGEPGAGGGAEPDAPDAPDVDAPADEPAEEPEEAPADDPPEEEEPGPDDGDDGHPPEEEEPIVPPVVFVPADVDPFTEFAAEDIYHQALGGATGAAYHDAWARNRDLGYAPSRLSAVTSSTGAVRFSGLWHKNSGVLGWTSHRGQTRSELADTVLARDTSGYRMADLDAHEVDGETRYNSIWVYDSADLDWDAAWDVPESGLTEVLYAWQDQGIRPTTLTAYRVGGAVRFALVGVADGLEWDGIIAQDSQGYAAAWTQYRERGLVPIDISAYYDDGLRYSGLWVDDPSVRSWYSHRDMSATVFEQRWIDYTAANYTLIDLDAYYPSPDGSELRYSGVWVRREARNQVTSNLSLTGPDMTALNDTLSAFPGMVGFVIEDLTNGNYVALNPHEHFYMASTTKVFIAARILAMIDEGARVGGAPLTLDRRLTFRASDYRQAADDSRLVVGQSYTVEQYLRWMINFSSTGATDRLHGIVAADLDAWVRDVAGLQNVGEITSICELDTRIIERFDSCYRSVPCHILEPWWRDRSTSHPDYSDHQACLGSPANLNRPSGTSTFDDLYSHYYAGLANSVTPAEYAELWRRLLDGDVIEQQSANLLVDILDGTGNGYVDDLVLNQGFFNGFGGKHGGKRKVRSWVGLAWYRNGSTEIADATFQYSVSIFTENWSSTSDDAASRTVINESIGSVFGFLRSRR